MTAMAVVEVVGVNPSGQASAGSPVQRTRSDFSATIDWRLPVSGGHERIRLQRFFLGNAHVLELLVLEVAVGVL